MRRVSRRDIRKYIRYILETESFKRHKTGHITPRALEAASQIRGANRGPSVMIHGIMPRSGTVYVGELIRLHPDLVAYPGDIWELPFLERFADLYQLQEEFLWSYEQNREKIGQYDFLPIFGASVIGYLHTMVPAEKRMLLKVPGVQYLDRFFDVFPHEQLILLVRDGRDVVHSTIRTWPQIRFWMACLRWRRAASMAMAVNQINEDEISGFWLARFEDAIANPESFVRDCCLRLDLDPDRYPWDLIDQLPVQGSSTLGQPGEIRWVPAVKPDGFQPIGHWRKWSPLRKMVFKRIAGDVLNMLGYGGEQGW